MPAVTVLMSCYNASRYVSKAVESILAQSYQDHEFIIVNDGSTDGTLEMLRGYSAKDGRIRILDKANTGLADSLNAGMQMAQGEWIARLDADDVALPERLAAQMAYVGSHPGTVLLGSGFIEIDGTGKALRTYRYPASRQKYVRRIQRTGCFAPHSSCLYHKATVERLGGFNPRFLRSQDADLWFRLFLVGEVAALPQPLVKIRKHGNNISNDDCGRMQATFGLAARACHFLRLRGAADPSAQSEEEWSRFVKWLGVKAEEHGLFRRRHDREELKKQYFSTTNKILAAWRLLRALDSFNQIPRIIRRRRFSTILAAALAQEWLAVRDA
ncbi:MAG TPA: glycosyltransferase [Sedimentisphaerales bacterium]|nr:glycosyltransferase [Sedimentisphaerales bacterium]HRS10920.1 glycosyltransferase [Sedimentisphaerales bacterium]HRV47624.1 glycosyltransferase [Sedimentisphaerales bacterium]